MAEKKQEKTKSIVGKAPPHSLEAEKALLCCIMIDSNMPVQIIPELTEDDFYSPAHKDIFKAIQAVYAKNKPVDFITIPLQLESEGRMERAGGIEYIGSINAYLPSAANFAHYLQIVKKLSINRRLIDSCNKIIEMAYFPHDENNPEQEVSALEFAEQLVYAVGEREQRGALCAIQPALNEAISFIEKLAKNPAEFRGIATPFNGLNYYINGLNKGDLIVIAARPGVGKTSFAMNLVENAALLQSRKDDLGNVSRFSCAIFSLEMPESQLVMRMLASVGGVELKKLKQGALAASDWKHIFAVKAGLKDAKIFIDASSNITPVDLISKCRRLKREHGLDLIMIDYLQLMSSGRMRVESRAAEVADITRQLKIAAKELNVPVLLLSQLNREFEKRGNKAGPRAAQLSDLRESGSIEQDADIVMFIENNQTNVDIARVETTIRIAKNRNGPTGKFNLMWEGAHVRFIEPTEEDKAAARAARQPKPEPAVDLNSSQELLDNAQESSFSIGEEDES